MWLNTHNVMVEVMLIQDCVLDFQKCPHFSSIYYLDFHFWISVYMFNFQNGHAMTSPAHQLANKKVYWNLRVMFPMYFWITCFISKTSIINYCFFILDQLQLAHNTESMDLAAQQIATVMPMLTAMTRPACAITTDARLG